MSSQSEGCAVIRNGNDVQEVVGRSSSGTELVALPPPPQGFAGTSQVKKDNFTVQVTNKEGYLSNIVVDALFNTSPEEIFALFTHADNSAVFRDIKSVAGRKVLESEGKRTVVEVEQVGEMRVLWMKKSFSTFLQVEEDATDPNHLVVIFNLLRSDVLARFQGRWDLKPSVDPKTKAVKCQAQLTQDVSPKGVPQFFSAVPVLGGLLRGIGVRTARRIVEDINAVVKQLNAGKTLAEILAPPTSPTQPVPTNVQSFAIDEEEDDDSNDDVVDELANAESKPTNTTPGEKGEADAVANGSTGVAHGSSGVPAAAGGGGTASQVAELVQVPADAVVGAGAVSVLPPGDVADKVHEAVVNLAQEAAGAKQAAEVAA